MVFRALTARDRYAVADAKCDGDSSDATYTVQRLRIKYVVPPLPMCPDWDRLVVRHIAHHMPEAIRDVRARACVEELQEAHGMWSDRPCPACIETPGWLDRQPDEVCPVCCGFGMIPRMVAMWYARERQALEAHVESDKVREARHERHSL